jgi:hypothetical protein
LVWKYTIWQPCFHSVILSRSTFSPTFLRLRLPMRPIRFCDNENELPLALSPPAFSPVSYKSIQILNFLQGVFRRDLLAPDLWPTDRIKQSPNLRKFTQSGHPSRIKSYPTIKSYDASVVKTYNIISCLVQI